MFVATHGSLQPFRDQSFQQILREHHNAVYTAAVVRQGKYFLSWNQHMERLAYSHDLLCKQFGAGLGAQVSEQQVAALVIPNLTEAFRAWQVVSSERSTSLDLSALVILHEDKKESR